MGNISEATKKKGQRLYEKGRVKKELETQRRTHFTVHGDTEKHSVIFDKERKGWVCDCRYFSLKQKECSHILAAKLLSSA